MGLAGAFGNQNYVCKSCGHSMPEFAPHCPKCLNKMARIQSEKQPGPSLSNTDAPSYSDYDSGNKPGVPLGLIATVMLALAVAAYSVFFAPKQPPAPVEATAPPVQKSEPVRTVKRVKRPTSAVAQTPKRSATAPRKHTAPMKLWTVTDDE
jgi:hypothetical protein